MGNALAKNEYALTIQNDFLFNSLLLVWVKSNCYRNHFCETLLDVYQAINALQSIVKNVASWLLLDDDINFFVQNSNDSNQHRRYAEDTAQMEKCGPWEKFHMS